MLFPLSGEWKGTLLWTLLDFFFSLSDFRHRTKRHEFKKGSLVALPGIEKPGQHCPRVESACLSGNVIAPCSVRTASLTVFKNLTFSDSTISCSRDFQLLSVGRKNSNIKENQSLFQVGKHIPAELTDFTHFCLTEEKNTL